MSNILAAMEFPSDKYGMPKTDHTKWRLTTDSFGRQNWIYDETNMSTPSNFTRYQMKNDFNPPQFEPKTAPNAREAAFRSFKFLSHIQDEDSGIFPCQYGGPMFLLIGYVTAKYFCKIPFTEIEKIEICRYIVNRAHPVDGGWGLHTYGDSTVFGTSINYVILRLLGMSASHPALVKARSKLMRMGGAIGNPMWGKAYLSILNLYDWSGVNPSPPEFWMLPYCVPFHPGRWWVHTRAIYLPMGYLSMNRCKCELNDLLQEIRSEIYTKPYNSIDFSKHRNTVCGVDLYYPHSKMLDFANSLLTFYEKRIRPDWLKKKASKLVIDLIMDDMKNTDYLAIAPISNALNAMVICVEKGRDSPEMEKVTFRWPDFLFMTSEGMLMSGTNGVQVWDVAFALQYCCVAGFAQNPEFKDMLIKGYRFLVRSQFDTECVEGSFRDKRSGGWPFSTKPQGFTVSDCTAESIKAILMVQNTPGFEFLKDEISTQRLHDGIDVLLSLQNKGKFHTGAFASYELIKGPEILEKLNPAEVFGNIMVEYPYVECTDSSILGLHHFTLHDPYRQDEITDAINSAIDYIISFQRPDGSWYGSWGVCFTYAGMFALEALSTQGYFYSNSKVVQRACHFLASKQEDDGGFAEDFRSCELFSYVKHEQSEVVPTAWALIALLLAKYPERSVLNKAAQFLINKQNSDGSYDAGHVEGVFNHSCAIEYPNYKFYFCGKALGLYAQLDENN